MPMSGMAMAPAVIAACSASMGMGWTRGSVKGVDCSWAMQTAERAPQQLQALRAAASETEPPYV